MPFVNVHVGKNLTKPQKDELAGMIAENMPIIPGKNKDNTMIEISGGCDMYMFGGSSEIIFVDVRVYKAVSDEIKNAFVAKLSEGFERILGISAERQYYNIIELPGWGLRSQFLS